MVTSNSANEVLINNVNMRLIILSWGFPSLTDWKSVVLNDTKRI